MFIATGVEVLEISVSVMGRESIIYPTVLKDEENVVLVDAGFPGEENLLKISEEMGRKGISLGHINKIILTHQDLDHIGGVASIRNGCLSEIEILSHGLEKPYIQGEKRPIKITDEVIAGLEALPNEWRRQFKAVFQNPPKVKVDKEIVDGEEVPIGDGVVVIHTPGHTSGHISLYVKESKTLIAGDALNLKNGKLYGPDPQQTVDMTLAMKSIEKLMKYDIETVICYHGGVYKGDVKRCIEELVRNKEY